MNTVMDDNKMLTLASNERIPLTPTMRLLLEINHMNHCSPATVSRGGVIFVNADDVGWKPVVDSWIEKLEVRLQGLPNALRQNGTCSSTSFRPGRWCSEPHVISNSTQYLAPHREYAGGVSHVSQLCLLAPLIGVQSGSKNW